MSVVSNEKLKATNRGKKNDGNNSFKLSTQETLKLEPKRPTELFFSTLKTIFAEEVCIKKNL